MTDGMQDFLSNGMRRYKQASATMVSFGREVESRLQGILEARTEQEWGSFRPDPTKRTRSTKYWSEYPLFNRKIDGRVNGVQVRISIDVNWYESEREYPFYSAWLDPVDPFLDVMRDYEWSDGIDTYKGGIKLYPQEKDFDLERDFRVLLDELVRFLNECAV